MAYTKIPYLITVLIFTIFIAIFSSSPVASKRLNLPSSTISAAPAVLPDFISPSSSPPPALSPDITPLFPSPGGSGLSPTMPLIPASPSPPNPDEMVAPGPVMTFGPSEPMPESFSDGLNAPALLGSVAVVFGAILVNGW